ncbi:MAG: MarP family serine protease [Nocardioides sp.]
MNLLDVLLLLLVLAYALSGYWQGFVTGAFATAGLLLGGLGGVLLAPRILGDAEPSLGVSLGALFIVIVLASVGQALLQFVGTRIRAKITWQPARALDAIGGALLSSLAVLLVAWALGVAISGSRIGGLTPLVRDSGVLRSVNSALPAKATNALDGFNDVVGTGFFPRYLEPFAREDIVEVSPGARRLLQDPDIDNAEASVLKIRGNNACGRGVEGSGFLYGEDRLMTNAHVVAGVDEPTIELRDATVPATVVYFNPDLDVAVLSFESGNTPVLDFVAGAEEEQQYVTEASDGVAILGYPEDGPYNVQRGRVRTQTQLKSPDIYGDGSVLRSVYSLRGLIRPGNSGGPILTTQGNVAGVVFAASVTDSDTGYALTWEQVAGAAQDGKASSSRVSTQGCAG